MFILDKPYISDFLLDTVSQHKIPVLWNSFIEASGNGRLLQYRDKRAFENAFRNGHHPMIYTNSENAIGWISQNLNFTALPDKISLFKDKVRFRDMLKHLDPDFYYRAASLENLEKLDPDSMNYPFIVKPAVGFFSLGVHKVESAASWPGTLAEIKKEVDVIREVYPTEVLDTTRFIIEENIEGREFAFDAYFDHRGQPVILGLLEHLFSSASDVSDRVYVSSENIFLTFLDPFTEFLNRVGKLADLRNFPMHVEVRVDEAGNIRPIEINPLRFGGWCTTADMTWFAYGFNSYAALEKQEIPDWKQLLKGKEDKIYSNIVLTNSTGHDVREILQFDYDALVARFEKPLEMRKADFREFLIFGFIFAETSVSNFREVEWILNDDLKDYITLK